MTIFALLSTLVTLAALFSLISFRVFKLPSSIGTTILALCSAGALIGVGHLAPGLRDAASAIVGGINFNAVVLHGMLAFLLFAGALQLDLNQLRLEKLPVLTLAVGGTFLSIAIVAGLFKLSLMALGIPLGIVGVLLFGTLISPTDPIAVLDMLRRVGAPATIEAQLAGESLFNDGVGAVVFLALLDATGSGSLPNPLHFLGLLALDAGGGIALGCVLGYITYRLLQFLDSYPIEVMLTLALAMGGYALADALHLSAPLEAVAAGLLLGGPVRDRAMSAKTRENVDTFWELIDTIMNVVLFLLLGMELLVLPLDKRFLFIGLIAIPIVLVARLLSVSICVFALSRFRKRVPGSITVLTWGGLRGGLAVALALGLPRAGGLQEGLLQVTYVVVVFSIVVQGLTIAPLLRHLHLTRSSTA